MNLKDIFQQDTALAGKLLLLELVSGERFVLDPLPVHVHVDGNFSHGDDPEIDTPRAFVFEERHGNLLLRRASIAPDVVCLLYGKNWEGEIQVQPDVEYLLQMNDNLYVFRFATGNWNWAEKIDTNRWFLFDSREDKSGDEYSYEELKNHLLNNSLDWNQMGVCVEGLEGAFTLKQLMQMPMFRSSVEQRGLAQQEEDLIDLDLAVSRETATGIEKTGPLLSPFCWERFGYGDIFHIAVDDRLMGDPILGDDELLRFAATRFDPEGNALDAYENSCSDLADPYTRYRLPQGFLELPQYIFSIVGAPGSGKSNYLSILVNQLQKTLFHDFGMVLKDADPTQNAPLNDMKNCLFGGGSIEQAALFKTQLDGKMYFKIKRGDRVLSYPRPFVYTLGRSEIRNGICNVVFYDNAGEHFEPGIEPSIHPGAQHVASADALFFLVDPATLPGFRQRLSTHPDPQLKQEGRIDQQDVLLSELEIRIRKARGLSVNEKIDKPLGIILGKSDIWMSLLDKSQFKAPIQGNLLKQDALLHNSNLIRQVLLEIAPNIVANAESISNQVYYFPVSAFGHSPKRLPSGSLAPDPARIDPYYIEIPTLWALSQKHPNAFKMRPKSPSARLIPDKATAPTAGSRLIPE